MTRYSVVCVRMGSVAAIAAAAALPLLPAAAHAQARWKAIGKTASGNSVFVDTRSVKRANGIVTAIVRVRFTQPVQSPSGAITSSRTLAMFDCARQTIAAKENTYFIDERAHRIADHTVNKQPGFGPALKGTLGDVALTYFCHG